MYCWGRQSSASLVTSVSSREAKPTRTKRKEDRDKKQKEAPHKHKKKPNEQEGGSQQNPTGQKAARRAEPNKEEKTRGRRQAEPAEKEREDAREGSRIRREKIAQAKKAGACSVSLQHGGEGKVPQGRSLCCQEEE